jgi:hypothetical protein
MYRNGQLPVESFFVVLTQWKDADAALRAYKIWSQRPVCFDKTDGLWVRGHISHTPVTALLHDGKVLYLHDAPLMNVTAKQQFLDAIRDRLR